MDSISLFNGRGIPHPEGNPDADGRPRSSAFARVAARRLREHRRVPRMSGGRRACDARDDPGVGSLQAPRLGLARRAGGSCPAAPAPGRGRGIAPSLGERGAAVLRHAPVLQPIVAKAHRPRTPPMGQGRVEPRRRSRPAPDRRPGRAGRPHHRAGARRPRSSTGSVVPGSGVRALPVRAFVPPAVVLAQRVRKSGSGPATLPPDAIVR